jgi:phage shock protein PspC (stress-responsive transcriptional regulator)
VWVLVALFPPVSTLAAVAAYIVLAYVIPEETDYIDV